MKYLHSELASLLGLLSLLASPAISAEVLSFDSGSKRVHLFELYTSQGCSSCPPADDWLSDLKTDPRLWRQVVPVAFHVDYWNFLGWHDKYSSRQHSARQRLLARQGGFQVYTPGFVLNGQEWRRSRFGRRLELGDAEPAGSLKVTLDQFLATINYAPLPGADESGLEVHVVQMGFDIVTPIGAGENHGRALRQDFVVLAHQVTALSRDRKSWHAEVKLRPQPARAMAAWVSRAGDVTPLQATGGWLDNRLTE